MHHDFYVVQFNCPVERCCTILESQLNITSNNNYIPVHPYNAHFFLFELGKLSFLLPKYNFFLYYKTAVIIKQLLIDNMKIQI